jgi:regulator of protease activity HflC (stomatin/prohibitin superfamily)
VDDKDDQCSIIVHTASGTASTWIVVELTEAQQQEQAARQKAEGKAKAQAFLNRAGKVWRLRFEDGATQTYTATGANEDGMPTFQSSAGSTVKIAVSNDNNVTIIEQGCLRSGKLVGSQVKNGQSMGGCTPSGSWSATVER